MTEHWPDIEADLRRWEDDGGAVPPEPGPDEPAWGPIPLRAAYGWWLTMDKLRRLFAGSLAFGGSSCP